jgi:hypothetical protein
MPILRILCYNGSLVTWTVVSFTTAKFKPLCLASPCSITNMFILMISYDFCFKRQLPAFKRGVTASSAWLGQLSWEIFSSHCTKHSQMLVSHLPVFSTAPSFGKFGADMKNIALIKNILIFWYVTPCSPSKVNRCFGGICRLHLQDLTVK